MKINTILNRYIFRELLSPFGINLSFLTFVFLMTQILEVTSMIVNYRVSVTAVGLILFYSMPGFLTYTIPMSVMLAVLLTFIRMSADNEITSIKAGGSSVYTLLPPVGMFCLMGALLTCLMTVYGAPWGKLSVQRMVKKVAATNIDVGLKARTFNGNFDGVMLYVNEIDMGDRTLRDIFVEDSRQEKIVSSVVAPRGVLIGGETPFTYVLRLYGGSINQVNLEGDSVNATSFSTYDIHLDLRQAAEAGRKVKKRRKEMSIPELLDYMDETWRKPEQINSAKMELHEKFAIPFACLALGLLAVPVGMQSASSRKKSSGLVIGLVFFLLYYMLLATGWSLGETGAYPPALAMWMPDIIMGGIGAYLLRRVAREAPVTLESIWHLLKTGILRIRARLG